MAEFRTFQIGLGFKLPSVLRNLLILNAVIWVIQQFTGTILSDLFALHPLAIINDFAFWQLFTYQFLHANFFHLFFNMFILFMFGREIELVLGKRQFLRYYLLTGIGGGFFQLIANWGTPSVILGASGAIYGILLAFGLLFPDRPVTFFFIIQLKAKTLVAIFIGISLVFGFQSELFGTNDRVAHFAHLGGAFTGFVLLRGRSIYQGIIRRIAQNQQKKRQERERQRQERIKKKRQEIDVILDRINEIGYENISEAEKDHLRRASEFLSNEEKIKS
ncbi:rhomboid family intramembrane serine protease [candidate division KSB1 bacterium]|nr:rhomboid family intramembrane serine protease [candidate division KSB1 bacterium]